MLCYPGCTSGTFAVQSPSGDTAVMEEMFIINMCCAYLKLYCLVLCALCVMLLCSVHLCREYAVSESVYFVGAVHCVCMLRHGDYGLPLKALH